MSSPKNNRPSLNNTFHLLHFDIDSEKMKEIDYKPFFIKNNDDNSYTNNNIHSSFQSKKDIF